MLNIESGLDLKAQVEREEWAKHTLFTFERVVAPDGKVITTKFAVGSALVWAVVLIYPLLKRPRLGKYSCFRIWLLVGETMTICGPHFQCYAQPSRAVSLPL